jgi:hypothetical protein
MGGVFSKGDRISDRMPCWVKLLKEWYIEDSDGKNERKCIDLNELAFEKIRHHEMIGFREVTRILGVNFHLSRDQTFQLLKQWKNEGRIKIISYHGIKILK